LHHVGAAEQRRNPETGHSYPWMVRSSAMVNHFYCYCVDPGVRTVLLKFCSYFPYNAKLCLNGHEYAKCQLRQEGIGFTALDYGFVSCQDAERLQTICEQAAKLIGRSCLQFLTVDRSHSRIIRYAAGSMQYILSV